MNQKRPVSTKRRIPKLTHNQKRYLNAKNFQGITHNIKRRPFTLVLIGVLLLGIFFTSITARQSKDSRSRADLSIGCWGTDGECNESCTTQKYRQYDVGRSCEVLASSCQHFVNEYRTKDGKIPCGGEPSPECFASKYRNHYSDELCSDDLFLGYSVRGVCQSSFNCTKTQNKTCYQLSDYTRVPLIPEYYTGYRDHNTTSCDRDRTGANEFDINLAQQVEELRCVLVENSRGVQVVAAGIEAYKKVVDTCSSTGEGTCFILSGVQQYYRSAEPETCFDEHDPKLDAVGKRGTSVCSYESYYSSVRECTWIPGEVAIGGVGEGGVDRALDDRKQKEADSLDTQVQVVDDGPDSEGFAVIPPKKQEDTEDAIDPTTDVPNYEEIEEPYSDDEIEVIEQEVAQTFLGIDVSIISREELLAFWEQILEQLPF